MHKPLAGVIVTRATPAGATCGLSRLHSSAPEVPHNFLLPVTYASRVRHGSTPGHNRVSPRLGHIRRPRTQTFFSLFTCAFSRFFSCFVNQR